MSGRMLSANLVAKAPGDHRGMVAVARDHLPQLLQAVLHDIGVRLGPHAAKTVPAPGRNLGLHENAVPVAVVQNPFILWPMNAREDAIKILQVIMIVRDPSAGLRHAKFRIASRTAL